MRKYITIKGKRLHHLDTFNCNASERFFRGGADSLNNISRTIKAMANDVSVVIENNMEEDKIDIRKELEGKDFRIRKLTPTECFRLMDVDEKHIVTLTESSIIDKKGREKQLISNSKLYQLAGNSIVVACMEHMFENLFYPTDEYQRGDQLSLF